MEENLFLANTFISFIELGYFVITRLMVLSTNLQYLYQWSQNVIITIKFIGVVFRKINLLTFIHVTKLIASYISMVLGGKKFYVVLWRQFFSIGIILWTNWCCPYHCYASVQAWLILDKHVTSFSLIWCKQTN